MSNTSYVSSKIALLISHCTILSPLHAVNLNQSMAAVVSQKAAVVKARYVEVGNIQRGEVTISEVCMEKLIST